MQALRIIAKVALFGLLIAVGKHCSESDQRDAAKLGVEGSGEIGTTGLIADAWYAESRVDWKDGSSLFMFDAEGGARMIPITRDGKSRDEALSTYLSIHSNSSSLGSQGSYSFEGSRLRVLLPLGVSEAGEEFGTLLYGEVLGDTLQLVELTYVRRGDGVKMRQPPSSVHA